MHIESHQIATLPEKPTHLEILCPPSQLLLSTTSSLALIDLPTSKLVRSIETGHKKITTLRYSNNIVFTGGNDNFIKLYDTRNWSLLNTFQRVPSKFQSIDVSAHILAGATSTSVLFWDLRKMKQRAEFKDSFNGNVLDIKFQKENGTNLYGCSEDGMINMFDLTQPNQQQALNWCYKLIECPVSLSPGPSMVLTQSSEQTIYKIREGELIGKTCISNPSQPKHILLSKFSENTNYEYYEYYSWSSEEKTIEKWVGMFSDGSNQEKCVAYLNNVADVVEVFGVIDGVGCYADERGNVCLAGFEGQKRVKKSEMEMEMDKEGLAINGKKWKFEKGKESKQQGHKKVTKNGYVLQKPVSSLSNHKKFKPY